MGCYRQGQMLNVNANSTDRVNGAEPVIGLDVPDNISMTTYPNASDAGMPKAGIAMSDRLRPKSPVKTTPMSSRMKPM